MRDCVDKKTRDPNMELLRIIAMVMIVSHHFAVHSGFDLEAGAVTLPRAWIEWMAMGGKVGVDIFVLISGYFLIGDAGRMFDLKKILRFWGQVFFYSMGAYLVFGAAGVSGFSVKTFIKAAFPITFSAYWFASTYFVMYLLHPFVNKFLLGFKKKEYQRLLILQFTCWCVIPTFTTSSYQGNSLIWFLCLYSLAGYIRLFGLDLRIRSGHYLGMWIVFSSLTYLSAVVLCILEERFAVLAGHSRYFYGAEKLSVFLVSVSLFMAVERAKVRCPAWINLFASATFGVYLIHDNNIVRYFLWRDVAKNSRYQDSAFLIIYSVIVVALVYILCTAIDLVRKYTVEKIYLKAVDACIKNRSFCSSINGCKK